MKKKIVAISLLLATTSVIAQSKFDGLYVQGGLGFDNYDTDLSNGRITSTAGTPPSGSYTITGSNSDFSNGVKGSLGVGYGFSLNSTVLVDVGVDYVTDSKYTTNSTISGGYSSSSSGKIKNKYTYYIAPGYILSKDSKVYAKLGYVTAKDVSDGDKSSLNGMSYGVGYKQFIDKNVYFFAEGSYIKMNSKDYSGAGVSYTGTYSYSTKSDGYAGFVGIGYKF